MAEEANRKPSEQRSAANVRVLHDNCELWEGVDPVKEMLTVSEVSRAYGVSARMLRHYEKMGQHRVFKHTESGNRRDPWGAKDP